MSWGSNPLNSEMKNETKYNNVDYTLESTFPKTLRLNYFYNMLKDTEASVIRSNVKNMIVELENYSDENKSEYIHDIFILAFYKRSTSKTKDGEYISNGEGCKNIYYEYILELYNYYPETIITIFKSGLPFIYGYWKDALNLWVKINELDMDIISKFTKYNKFIEALRHSMLAQRGKDLEVMYNLYKGNKVKKMNSEEFKDYVKKSDLDYSSLTLSNVGKFSVRENTSFNRSAYWYNINKTGLLNKENHVSYMIRYTLKQRQGNIVEMFPNDKSVPFGAKKIWRLDNAKLNVLLDVAETHFAGGTWNELNIGNIPSICLKKNNKGLINEKLNEKVLEGSSYDVTGNRFPDNTDRVECRKNVKDYIISNKNKNHNKTSTNDTSSSINPWITFRFVMDKPYFEKIREYLRCSQEKYLRFYN
jgi:hypothetical protein